MRGFLGGTLLFTVSSKDSMVTPLPSPPSPEVSEKEWGQRW